MQKLFDIDLKKNPYSNCHSEFLIFNEQHVNFCERRFSEINEKEVSRMKRSYVLINVYLRYRKIINMNMNPREADQVLKTLDLSEDKNILLSKVTNKMLLNNNQDQQRDNFDGIKFIFINQLQKMGYYSTGPDDHQKDSKEVEVETSLCKICMDLVPFDELVVIPNCGEEFCKQCLTDYLQNKIIISDVMNISCPSDQCLSVLDDQFIKFHLDPMFYQKYQNSDSTIRWCPTDCERYVKGQPGDIKLICPCGAEICFQCGGLFHERLTCDQALDETYKEAMKKFLIHHCPNCKIPIQKQDGCNHMTCYSCRYEFCWICKRKYSANHYGVWNFVFGCPGMQNVNIEPHEHPIVRRACTVVLMVLAAPFVLVILGILSGLFGPMFIYINIVRRAQFMTYTFAYRIFVYFMWLILGIIFYPLSMAVLVTLILGYVIYQTFCLIHWLISHLVRLCIFHCFN